MTAPLPIIYKPGAGDSDDFIASLPAGPGIYALSVGGNPAHIGWSANLTRRLKRLLGAAGSESGRLMERLHASGAYIECWPTGSKLETSLLMYVLAKSRFPTEYRTRLRLRTPWFLGLSVQDAFPRLAIVSRNARENENFLGPFATRESAERYAEEVQGLFQIRRCAEALEPSPEHPGCIYGEMNQCLRPCQCVVTREEYGTEAARVAEFLGTNGRTMLRNLAAARDRASNDMHFEEAGQIHKRIEKVKAAAAAREREIAEIDKFSGVALTRSAFPHRFQLWPMYEGYWQDPVVLDVSNVQPRTKPLDIELRERLSESVAAPSRDGNRAEHLALFLRWYRSSWRDGDWFPFTTVADLNYRKLVREISTLDKAEGPS